MTAFVFSLVLSLGVILFWAFDKLWRGAALIAPYPVVHRAGAGAASSVAQPAYAGTVPQPVAMQEQASAPVQPTEPAVAAAGSVDVTQGDNLRRMIGIGPANERHLKAAGVTTFAQIAAWTPDDVRRVEAIMAFDGRIARERWIEQARYLAAGDVSGFEKAFPNAGGAGNT